MEELEKSLSFLFREIEKQWGKQEFNLMLVSSLCYLVKYHRDYANGASAVLAEKSDEHVCFTIVDKGECECCCAKHMVS